MSESELKITFVGADLRRPVERGHLYLRRQGLVRGRLLKAFGQA